MSEAKPRLAAVSTPPAEEPTRASGGGNVRRGRRLAAGRSAAWLVAALLVLAVVALALQTLRVSRLSAEVEGLGAELAAARSALAAYEGQQVRVRDSVAELRARIGELDELVRRDPLAPSGSPP